MSRFAISVALSFTSACQFHNRPSDDHSLRYGHVGRPSPVGPRPGYPSIVPSDFDLRPLRPGAEPLTEVLGGRVAVIDLWATWCEPCRTTIPQLIRLADMYGPRGLVVVGINVGDAEEEVDRYAEESAIDYPVYLDPKFAFADMIGARSLPTIMVVDRSGSIVHVGTKLDAVALELIEEQLDRVGNRI